MRRSPRSKDGAAPERSYPCADELHERRTWGDGHERAPGRVRRDRAACAVRGWAAPLMAPSCQPPEHAIFAARRCVPRAPPRYPRHSGLHSWANQQEQSCECMLLIASPVAASLPQLQALLHCSAIERRRLIDYVDTDVTKDRAMSTIVSATLEAVFRAASAASTHPVMQHRYPECHPGVWSMPLRSHWSGSCDVRRQSCPRHRMQSGTRSSSLHRPGVKDERPMASSQSTIQFELGCSDGATA